jgi:hypothetical protein
VRTTTSRADLWTVERFRSFELEFEFKVEPGSNGGIKYLVQSGSLNRIRNGKRVGDARAIPAEPGDLVTESTLGFEYQILDDEALDEGKKGETRTAALYQLLPSVDPPPAPVGVFHRGRIVVDGDRVEHYLNGKLVMKTALGSAELDSAFVERKRNPVLRKLEKRETPVVITHHWTPVWYRNVRIRRLD